MIKKSTFVLLLILSCSLLSACRIPFMQNVLLKESPHIELMERKDTVDQGPVRGGTLNLFTTVPDTCNPLNTKNAYVKDFTNLIFEGLVKLNQKQEPTPMLSDTWQASADGLTWDFHIREGVYWHDGRPLTVEDVIFTIQKIMENGSLSMYKASIRNIITFASVGNHTIRFVLAKPNSFTPLMMTFPIIPQHVYQKDANDVSESRLLIGTGPYQLKSYQEKDIELSANEAWWHGADSGEDGVDEESTEVPRRPYIKTIHVKVYQDPEIMTSALQSREIDVAYIQASEYEIYQGRNDLVMRKYPSRKFEYIAFNLSKGVFSDVTARRVVASSISVSEIVQKIVPGGGICSKYPVMPGSWLGEESSGDNSDQDKNSDKIQGIEGIKALLEQNGWQMKDQIFEKKIHGEPVKFTFELLVNSENIVRNKIAKEIMEQLSQKGIKAVVTSVGWEEVLKRMETGSFDMVLTGCTIPTIPDVSFMYGTPYLSSAIFTDQTACYNASLYNNDVVNASINRIFSGNEKEKINISYRTLKKLVDEDMPNIGLFFSNRAILYSSRIRGNVSPDPWDRLAGLTAWYLPS